MAVFERDKHIRYLESCLNILPQPYEGQDNNRVTLLYFVLGSLDILGELDRVDKKKCIEFIYSNQVIPLGDDCSSCGFRGSPFLGLPHNSECDPGVEGHELNQAHIAMTYTALCSLRMLGDDYSCVNKRAIIDALKSLRHADGSYSPVSGGSEHDMRFIYCAAAISALLEDWSGFDAPSAVEYLKASQSYTHALAQGPFQEDHAGSTYCGVAMLVLCGRLDALASKEKLVQWLVERQHSGFQGRANKDPDTCYSFWAGGSLHLLGCLDLANRELSRGFTLSCQSPYGGFQKCPGVYPDVLHTYFSLAGLSLMGYEGLSPLCTSLGITERAAVGLPMTCPDV